MKSKNSKPKVVIIGGGTGTFVVLSGLKNHTLDLTAIVTMMDSGGSTGRLRDQLGVLPPGDLRQALVALSSSDKIWRDLFAYRFDAGDLEGHNFGNLFLSALEKMTGSIETGLELMHKILDTKGQVIPVTLDKCHLCVRLKDQTIVEGETFIDEANVERSPIDNCFLKPQAFPNEKALTAIKEADFIIIGPGDLYTSLIPNFLVTGVAATIKNSKSKKIYINNLMSKFGQTDNYTAMAHLKTISNYLDGTQMDVIMINTSLPNKDLLEWYKKSSEAEMVFDDLNDSEAPKVIRGDFLSDTVYEKALSDRLKRSLIRHDSQKLSRALVDIIFKN